MTYNVFSGTLNLTQLTVYFNVRCLSVHINVMFDRIAFKMFKIPNRRTWRAMSDTILKHSTLNTVKACIKILH